MSITSVWEFLIPASPRALSVYPAIVAKTTTNPFDAQSPSPETFSVVIGTDQGTIHLRTFNKGGGSQNPLGTTPSSPRSSVPRHWLPLDLRSLPGPVAHCVVIHQRYRQQQLYLLLIHDTPSSVDYSVVWAVSTVASPGFQTLAPTSSSLPSRISCAVTAPTDLVVYTTGRTLSTMTELPAHSSSSASATSTKVRKRGLSFRATLPGTIRSGPDALVLTSGHRVAVCAVGNIFYAVPGRHGNDLEEAPVKIHSFQQTSQVHPVILLELQDHSVNEDWSSLFLASGRECAVVDIFYNGTLLTGSKPRHETVTTASPILAAATAWPIVAILQSDGLVSIRSPSCLGISLRTVEVGQQPNDFFLFRNIHGSSILAAAYSGVTKVVDVGIVDSTQDMADRLLRHSMDAFGSTGFPRAELVEAIRPSFPATSYVGEAASNSKVLLKQYLEAVLGLTDFESGATPTWPTELNQDQQHHQGTFSPSSTSGRGRSGTPPDSLLTFSAMLCLVCSQLLDSTVANRAAKACAEKMGVGRSTQSAAATHVCELVAERLLREAASQFSLVPNSSPAPITQNRHSSTITDFVEASIWLLRACGKHERAIDVAYERLQLQAAEGQSRGAWSQIKYESYTATHLSELWGAGDESTCRLVLTSSATHRLLEQNPRLGLSVFTSMHPQNEEQWKSTLEDPLAYPDRVYEVLKLLKSINPSVPLNKDRSFSKDETPVNLPLESGRAVAITFLRSSIGISTGRPIDEEESGPVDETFVTHQANFHDELSFMLLEGVIAERPEDDSNDAADTELGHMYRSMLRELLKWPLTKIRTEQLMDTLPPSFLQEKALILGRVGKHEEALRILYRDLDSLELALEYCDDRFDQQKAHDERKVSSSPVYHDVDRLVGSQSHSEDNAYLPLVRVALESGDKDRGTAAAIKVLSMRRGAIDRTAALRLLPSDVPVSQVARPFLIPALVDSESQVRRMAVVSSLLRSRYLRLKEKLTEAQLKAQANIHVVPALRSLNLGDPLHSTKSFRIRTTSSSPGTTMPYVEVVKHFFGRHLVIQAKVTNSPYTSGPSSTYGNDANQSQHSLSDIAFVVAESSEEEAIQPMLQIPIQLLPPKLTGSAWCVLSAVPSMMEGPTAQLTCELRYAVQSGDASLTTVPWANSTAMARTFVEELQDLEVHATHFS